MSTPNETEAVVQQEERERLRQEMWETNVRALVAATRALGHSSNLLNNYSIRVPEGEEREIFWKVRDECDEALALPRWGVIPNRRTQQSTPALPVDADGGFKTRIRDAVEGVIDLKNPALDEVVDAVYEALIKRLTELSMKRTPVAPAEPRGPTDAEIDSACMWYRHDFFLLPDAGKDVLRLSARDWLRAWCKVRDYLPPPAVAAPASSERVRQLEEVARNVVDCWGVGRLNITAMCEFVDELRRTLAGAPDTPVEETPRCLVCGVTRDQHPPVRDGAEGCLGFVGAQTLDTLPEER